MKRSVLRLGRGHCFLRRLSEQTFFEGIYGSSKRVAIYKSYFLKNFTVCFCAMTNSSTSHISTSNPASISRVFVKV